MHNSALVPFSIALVCSGKPMCPKAFQRVHVMITRPYLALWCDPCMEVGDSLDSILGGISATLALKICGKGELPRKYAKPSSNITFSVKNDSRVFCLKWRDLPESKLMTNISGECLGSFCMRFVFQHMWFAHAEEMDDIDLFVMDVCAVISRTELHQPALVSWLRPSSYWMDAPKNVLVETSPTRLLIECWDQGCPAFTAYIALKMLWCKRASKGFLLNAGVEVAAGSFRTEWGCRIKDDFAPSMWTLSLVVMQPCNFPQQSMGA